MCNEESDAKGVPSARTNKLREFLFPSKPPGHWSSSAGFQTGRCIQLEAILEGIRSLIVTGKLRLIFRYDEETNTGGDIDMIDYHQQARNAHEELDVYGVTVQKRDRERATCSLAAFATMG